MEIESDAQLEAYLKVGRFMRQLVGGCFERDFSESTPTLVFVDSGGTTLEQPRSAGYVEAIDLLEMMKKVQ